MKIKGAIFDMDGTLVESLFFWPMFWKMLGKKYLGDDNFSPDEDIDKRIRTMVFVDALKVINKHFHFGADDDELIAYADQSVKAFYATEVYLKVGAAELLEHLQKQGIKMCLASATEMELVKFTLARLGIDKYFDAALSCADIGVGKDKPDIYLLSAKQLDLAPEELCVFEDSFVALETAKKAGFKTVGIFDRNNFGQDRLRAAAEIYVENGQSLNVLAENVEYPSCS